MSRVIFSQILLLFLSQSGFESIIAIDETYRPEVKLYRSHDCQGEFLFANYKLDSFVQYPSWEDKIHSALIRGPWIFYEHEYFNSVYEGSIDYIYSPRDICFSFQNVGGKISSFQFAGNGLDYRVSSLTIYKKTDYQGGFDIGQVYMEKDLPNVELQSQMSLILTGNIPFQIYAEPDYKGGTFCIVPPPSKNVAPYAIPDFWSASIAYDSIRSVRLGCQQDYSNFFGIISGRYY
ncbi:unnamed protein product [Allacma fusca]|uniref:Uncharacterized protein n=1 Tax=Allacma fusca TaxID=39272 RepID=A0A8J2P892_9HEXA|nr:unnamed protein product [Allacma fusca]